MEHIEEEEISEETITTTTTKRKKKKRRTVSSSRAQSRNRQLQLQQQQQQQQPEIVMVEQPLKLDSGQKLKKHHASDSGVNGGGFTFVTSIERDFPARYEWKDCLVPVNGGVGVERSDGVSSPTPNSKPVFQRQDSNQSTNSSRSTKSSGSAQVNNYPGFEESLLKRATRESSDLNQFTRDNKYSRDGSDPKSYSPHNVSSSSDANHVVSRSQPTTVVKREYDDNGGVTKTVTTTTTEEREYKVVNFDLGDEEAAAAAMDETLGAGNASRVHDDLRLLTAARSSAAAPKKRVVTFNDDLKLVLDDRSRQHVRQLGGVRREERAASSGTIHVPVRSEVRSRGEERDDAGFRLRFLWRQPQVKGPSHVCSVCQSPIEGRCVTALFKKFHPEHFACSYCRAQLSQGTFKEHGNKPYCQKCFTRL